MKEQKRRLWLYMATMALTLLLVLCLGLLVGLVYVDERDTVNKTIKIGIIIMNFVSLCCELIADQLNHTSSLFVCVRC